MKCGTNRYKRSTNELYKKILIFVKSGARFTSVKSSQLFLAFNDLKSFLLTRVRALEAAQPHTPSLTSSSAKIKKSGRRDEISSHSASTTPGSQCPLCKDHHSLRSCARFKAYSVEQRREQVRKARACFNCLGYNHTLTACPSTNRCRLCHDKHHSLLHAEETAASQPPAQDSHTSATLSNKVAAAGEAAKVAALSSSISSMVLLATAIITLISESGRTITARALLDFGSEASFVSERVAQQLRLRRRKIGVTVSGLQGVTTGKASHAVSLLIGSRRTPSLRIALPNALVMPKLTPFTPGIQVRKDNWPHLEDLDLADPGFDRPAAVDAILGADIYGMLIEGGVRRGSPGEPAAHSTVFGWVLMGPLTAKDNLPPSGILSYHTTVEPDLGQQLQRFWDLEEVSSQRILSPDENYCEHLFKTTHSRDAQGRYIVRLPKKPDPPAELGDSRRGALRLLLQNENRLSRITPLRQSYTDFMSLYSALGHMEPVSSNESNRNSYYLPHHAVTKKNDPGGKLRVVFNTSFRTTTGVSLNDLLLPGPRLQADLWLVLTHWRLHRFAFTTDIVKMFRQIRVHHEDADLQRVLWRAEPGEKITDYRLVTVTYGTAPAPYLAIRTLLQLAQDEEHRFPKGAAAIRSNTYVDDILAGASTLEEALEVKDQLVGLLEAGGFQLSKWAGTHSAFCPDATKESVSSPTQTVWAHLASFGLPPLMN
ncbi:uncharacterized protein LOC112637510 [Camponotus floridanus]|uniref:uncharacterized protein LOC112637510 n=1 Tax=Camponotus floridanus TaxID=104421 RepID=UPI000DC6A536|nr:uncharacterized protein LOC112637510 [Camponotus floridanus]